MLKKIALVLLLPVLLIIAVLIFVMNSRAGAQWAVERLVVMSGSDIRIPEVNGSLAKGMSLPALRYQDDDHVAQLEGLELEVNWSSLMAGKLMLESVSVRNVSHQQTDAEPDASGLQIELPQWPFTLCVEKLRIHEVRSGEGDALVLLENIKVNGACIEGDEHRLAVTSASLATLGVALELRQVAAEVRGPVPLTAELSWHYPEHGWSGTGPVSGTLELLELNQQVSGPFPFALEGTVAPFDGPAPLLNLHIGWQEWQSEEIYLRAGTAHLSGVLDKYSLAYQFEVEAPEIPLQQVSGNGQGNLEGLDIVDATSISDMGDVRYQGFLDWSEAIRSEGTVSVSGFDPSRLHESLSGSLQGEALFILDESDEVRFDGFRVDGELNGRPLDLRGNAQAGPDIFRCDSCRLLAGDNEIQFDGFIDGQQIDAQLAIRAPSLQSVWPGLSGRINAEGSLGGPVDSPIFSGRAGGTDLAYAGWTLARLNINSGSVGNQGISFSLVAQDLSYDNAPPALVTAEGSGQFDALNLMLNWESDLFSATLQSVLNLDDEQITGILEEVNFSEPQVGTWVLDEPFTIRSDATGVSASASRWRNEDSEVTITTFEKVDQVTVFKAALSNWALENLQPLIPENQQLRGTADAEVDVSYRDGAWSGSVEWRQADTVLVASIPGNEQAEISIPRARLQLLLAGGGATASAQLSIEPDVSAELQLSVDRVSRDAVIEGNIELTGNDWSWVSAVVPELDRLDGKISASIFLAGPAMAPNIRGSLDWKQGRIMIPALNIMLDDVDLSLAGEPSGAASLTGTARAGEGTLAISGRFERIMTSERSAQISITGDTAELLNWPEYHVWVSPEIDIQSSDEGWELRGKLGLPKAEVQIRELPEGAVTISEDVRVLGAEEPALRPTRYFGEARLSLGDQVRVQLFGLDTRLAGDLLIRVPRGRPPTATGEVSLVGGTFEAYGQKLQIEQGTLLFTGPFDNPVVDVRAIRIIETFDGPVTAGIHLKGRALSLSSEVYSVPAMAEADALSYLVIGRPLSQASDAEGADVSNAAIALGLGQASRITQQIGARLGLDQLNLVGDGGQGTALVAGKQLNKRLYARYAYGVFSRLGTLLLRYKLSRRLAIEAASGERQSLDILYTVEKQ
ncbi:MAG: hypothetical protein HKO64_08550 [Xanthomonadales bacterium]|nr:hypothetical protein [Xanthomonadales bacterium]